MYPLIDHEHQIIFFYSPKCACTSIKIYYASICTCYKNLEITNIHRNIGPLKENEIIDIDQYTNYKKLWIARNPYDRLVSGFLYLLNNFVTYVYRTLPDQKFAGWFGKRYMKNQDINKSYQQIIEYKNHPSFRNFVKILLTIDIKTANKHISLQSLPYFCHVLNKSNFDEIVNIRYLNDRLHKLNEELGVSGNITISNITHFNDDTTHICDVNIIEYTKQHNKTYPRYQYFYDNEIKADVDKIYHEDFLFIDF